MICCCHFADFGALSRDDDDNSVDCARERMKAIDIFTAVAAASFTQQSLDADAEGAAARPSRGALFIYATATPSLAPPHAAPAVVIEIARR